MKSYKKYWIVVVCSSRTLVISIYDHNVRSHLGGWCITFRGSGSNGRRPGSIGGIPPIPRKSGGGGGSADDFRIDFGLGGNIEDVPEDEEDDGVVVAAVVVVAVIVVDDNGVEGITCIVEQPEFWLIVKWAPEDDGVATAGVVVVGVGLSHFSFSIT